jgi:hypothetical protein
MPNRLIKMQLKWLKDFVALHDYGSFSKAAEARYVTQPAFSRRIRSQTGSLHDVMESFSAGMGDFLLRFSSEDTTAQLAD